jgi:ABC-type lipoprotein export system ATPase subunit
MSAEDVLVGRSVGDLIAEFPYVENYFAAIRLEVLDPSRSVVEILNEHPEEYFHDYGTSRADLAADIVDFVEQVRSQTEDRLGAITSVTVLPGRDKAGRPEACGLTVRPGEVTCIVGPTGAGKSRLLEDIECLAQTDTPSGRRVLINGAEPTDEQRYDLGHRLVAQLTQNMNFVIDLPAGEFIALHAESREVASPERVAVEVIAGANSLAGEPIDPATPVTQLSGGQSRALMIADTALLSASPIVLIDEIENAGIDRRRALDLLVGRDKIVLMSTHDPILALLGDRRVVIEGGGVRSVLATTEAERANLAFLTAVDEQLRDLRDRIRRGERVESDLAEEFTECWKTRASRSGDGPLR